MPKLPGKTLFKLSSAESLEKRKVDLEKYI